MNSNPYFYMKPTTLAEIVRDMTESIENEQGREEDYARILRAAYANLIYNCGKEDADAIIGFDPVADKEVIEPLPSEGDFISFNVGNSKIAGMIMSVVYNIDTDAHHMRIQLDPDDDDPRHWLTADIACSGPNKRGFSLT